MSLKFPLRAVSLALLALSPAAPALAQAPSTWIRIEPMNPVPSSRFGRALDMQGDLLAVGASFLQGPLAHLHMPPAGLAYVFREVGGSWVEEAVLTPPDSHIADGFGWRVVLADDQLLVSAQANNTLAPIAGRVYVYEQLAGTWSLVQQIVGSDTEDGDLFGSSVAVDGNRMLVGAALEGFGHGEDWGKVYAFERTPAGWVETQAFAPPQTDRHDWAGYDVALSGDRALVGMYADDVGAVDAGSAWVYEFGPNGWQPDFQLLPSDPRPYGHFSVSLALDGDHAYVGAHRAGTSADGSGGPGAIYIFEKGPGGWVEIERLSHEFLGANAVLGLDVIVDDWGGLWSGAAGSFGTRGVALEWADNTYAPRGAYQPPQLNPTAGLGVALASEGHTLALGAPNLAVGFPADAGAVYLMDPRYADRRRVFCDHQDLLWVEGSLDLGDDDLNLRASDLPADQSSLAFYADQSAPQPIASGDLCVSSPFYRLPVTKTQGSGLLKVPVDLASYPAGAGTGQLMAGSTWTFQAWVRDPQSLAGSRLTSALELRFAP